MIRAIWFLIKIGLLVALAVWVADRPGYVEIEWLDYTLNIQVGFFLLAMLATILFAIFLYRVIRTFVDFPRSYARYLEIKRREKGRRALTLGLTAVAAGDAKAANYQAHRALKLLSEEEGLALLLDAQAARLEGREEDARRSFEALLENKDAAFLGLRGLLQAEIDAGHDEQALQLAHEALRLHPKQGWILLVAYDLHIRMQNWEEAEKILYRAEKAGAIEPDQANNSRVAMLLAQADTDLKGGYREQARSKLKKAYKYDPDFEPTILRLAKIYVQGNRRRSALKVMEKAWKNHDHPDLVPLWEALLPAHKAGDPAARMKWYEKLVEMNPKSAEAHMALGRVALEHGLWGEARDHLKRAEDLKPGKRLYRLFAELEEKAGPYESAARAWLQKAADAPAEPAWVCTQTGRVYERWQPVAEPHGSFNTIRWLSPKEVFSGPHSLAASDHDKAGALLEAPKS